MLKHLLTGERALWRRARRDWHNRRPRSCLRVETLEDRLVLSGDMVLRWNQALLAAMQVGGLGNPPVNGRIMAIVQTAVYEAVNSIDGTYAPYLVNIPAPAFASEDAAVATAAHDTLVALYPGQTAALNLELKASLQGIDDGDAKDWGIRVGQAAAQIMLAVRAHDGSDKPMSYTPGTNPGDWQPTPPAYLPPLSPQWATVTPFCLQSASQFRPPPPPALTSPEYTAAFNQVKQLGAFDSTTRTADETEAALFWAGVTAPPNFYLLVNDIAQTVAINCGNSLVQNARMFALVDLGLADEPIANWDAKYTYNFWRPVTAIRNADQTGNPDTEADPNWTSLEPAPPIPSYPSQHSSAIATTAAILTNFFGTDAVPFSVSWESLPGVTRSFATFTDMANECAMSRIWIGFHYSFDITEGLKLGRSVGEYISQNFLLPRTSSPPGGGAASIPFTTGNVSAGQAIGASLVRQARHSLVTPGLFTGRTTAPDSSSLPTDAPGAGLHVDQSVIYLLPATGASNHAASDTRAVDASRVRSTAAQPQTGDGSLDDLLGSADL